MADKSPPPLVWANGRPMMREQLAQEVAGPRMSSVRSVVSGHPAQNLTPWRLANLLLAAEQGDAIAYLELAEEMEEKDLHYQSVMGTRKRQVSQLPIEVEEGDDSAEAKRDAELVRDWLKRDVLESELFDILDAAGKGYSATEIIWDTSRTPWLPIALKWRDPRWFEFDRIDMETLMLRSEGGPQPLSAAKFITHCHQAKSGIPIRGGIARAVAWGYMFKNYAMKDWLSFLEVYGLPMRVGRYDNGETETNIDLLRQAVADLGVDAAAVFPKTMEIEFIDGKQGAAPAELWQGMAIYIDDQVSKAVLGQTNTTDAKAGGLGSGQAQVHNDVRGDIERADAKLLAATLNRDLVVPMIAMNFGPRDNYPRIKIGRPDEVDVDAMVKAATALVPLGVKVGADQMREAAGLPAPEKDEEVLVARASPSPQEGAEDAPGADPRKNPSPNLLDPLKSPLRGIRSGQEERAAASTAATSTELFDAVDWAAEEAIGDWEVMMAPIVAPIRTLAASAATLEEFRDGLAALIGGMDASPLTEMLAQARFGARLQGDAGVQTDQRG